MVKPGQSTGNDVPRKRGRPTGKNRVPLTLEERRARNAQYERERREQTADAMRGLAEAAGCDPSTSHTVLLATAVSQIKASARSPAEDLEELRHKNASLVMQIAELEDRLRNGY